MLCLCALGGIHDRKRENFHSDAYEIFSVLSCFYFSSFQLGTSDVLLLVFIKPSKCFFCFQTQNSPSLYTEDMYHEGEIEAHHYCLTAFLVYKHDISISPNRITLCRLPAMVNCIGERGSADTVISLEKKLETISVTGSLSYFCLRKTIANYCMWVLKERVIV